MIGAPIRITVMAVCLAGWLAALTQSAEAKRMTVLSRHGPAGQRAGHDGWVNARTGDGPATVIARPRPTTGSSPGLAVSYGRHLP